MHGLRRSLRMATTSFFTHHLRVISLTAVVGAALPVAIILRGRKPGKSHLLSGAPIGRPACWPLRQ
jgi:hypothetical protein